MTPAGGDGHDIRQVRRDVGQTAPRHHGSVFLQRQRMKAARRNRDDVRQTRRHVGLPIIIGTPGHDRAVAPQREAEVAARRNRHGVRQAGGNGVIGRAPVGHGAIAQQSEALVAASGNAGHVRQTAGNIRLVQMVPTPR